MNTLNRIGFSDNENIVIIGQPYEGALAVIKSSVPELSGIYIHLTDESVEIDDLIDLDRSNACVSLSIEAIWHNLDCLTDGKFSKASKRLSVILKAVTVKDATEVEASLDEVPGTCTAPGDDCKCPFLECEDCPFFILNKNNPQ